GVRSDYYIPFVRPDQFEAAPITDTGKDRQTVPARIVKTIEKDDKGKISKNPTEEYFEIFSADQSGTIGYNNESKSDDPSDNIFSFNIDKSILQGKEIRLSYEVYGIENVSGVPRSINENTATG